MLTARVSRSTLGSSQERLVCLFMLEKENALLYSGPTSKGKCSAARTHAADPSDNYTIASTLQSKVQVPVLTPLSKGMTNTACIVEADRKSKDCPKKRSTIETRGSSESIRVRFNFMPAGQASKGLGHLLVMTPSEDAKLHLQDLCNLVTLLPNIMEKQTRAPVLQQQDPQAGLGEGAGCQEKISKDVTHLCPFGPFHGLQGEMSKSPVLTLRYVFNQDAFLMMRSRFEHVFITILQTTHDHS